MRAPIAADREARAPRQHQIEQHRVGPHTQHFGERLITARDEFHLYPVRAQVLRREPPEAFVVLGVDHGDVFDLVARRVGVEHTL